MDDYYDLIITLMYMVFINVKLSMYALLLQDSNIRFTSD